VELQPADRSLDPAVSWAHDVHREPATDSYHLDRPWDDLVCTQVRPAVATCPQDLAQVNSVYTSLFAGSGAIVPWMPPDVCVRMMSPIAVSQRLLGLVSPIRAQRNRVFWLKLTPPFGTKQQIFPQDMSLHETASANNALGELAAYTTTCLLAQQCGLGLRIIRRKCHNRVYITYGVHRPVHLHLLAHPACRYLPGVAGGEDASDLPCRDPSLGKRVVLVGFSANPRILVGTSSTAEMRRAMGVFLPRLLSRKRKRQEDDEEGRSVRFKALGHV
jgi:hypothetical protein